MRVQDQEITADLVHRLGSSAPGESLGSGLAYQYAYFASLSMTGALFYIYLVHYYPAPVVGSIAILLAIISLIPPIFSLGFQSGWQHFISYEIGKGNPQKVASIIRQAVKTSALLSVLAITVLLAITPEITISLFHSRAYIGLVYSIAPVVPLIITSIFLNNAILGLQRFKRSGQIGIASVLTVYGSAILLLNFTHSVYSIPIGWALGYSVSTSLYYIDLRDDIHRVLDREERFSMRPLILYSLPLYLTGIMSSGATYVDRLTVAFLRNLTSVGVYNLALLIASGVAILSTPLGAIVFSKLSEFYGKNDKELIREGVRLASNAASIIYVPAALGLCAISSPVIDVIGGKAYESATFPLVIILILSAALIALQPLSAALQGTRKTYVFILATSMALVTNTALSFTLIPTMALVGAALGYESAFIVQFTVILYFALKENLVRFDKRFLSRIWLSATSMAAGVFVIAKITGFRIEFIPLYVGLGLVIYLYLLRLTSTFTDSDKIVLLRLLPLRPAFIRRLVSYL